MVKLTQIDASGQPTPRGAVYTITGAGWPVGAATGSAVFRAGTAPVPANGLCGRRFAASVQ